MGRDITCGVHDVFKEFVEKMNIESVTRCANCKNWLTPIAYTPTGKCKLDGKITNRNYFCADGREKDG